MFYDDLTDELYGSTITELDNRISHILDKLNEPIVGNVAEITVQIAHASGLVEALHLLEFIDDNDYEVYVKRLQDNMKFFKTKAFPKKGLLNFMKN